VRRALVFSFGLCAVSAFAADRPANPTAATKLLAPAFTSTSKLGPNVSRLLALQVWTTFRRQPAPNPEKLDFGRGEVDWSDNPLDELSAETARQAGKTSQRQLVLWGSAFQYGSGVLVEARLTIPDVSGASTRAGRWIIVERQARLELPLPSSDYVFSPLVLSPEVVERYSTLARIPVCAEKVPGCSGPPLLEYFEARRQEPNYAFIEQMGAQGWIHIPDLSRANSEVVGFTSAMAAYIRGDFEQAERHFRAVAESDSDSVVRFDSLVLSGISRTRSGKNGSATLRAALERNPYSRYTAQALVMSNLAVASREAGAANGLRSEADKVLRKYRHLFGPNDPWAKVAESLVKNP